MIPLSRRYRHIKRYREIARVLVRHGFGHLVEQLELTPFLSLPRRLLRKRAPKGPPLSKAEHLRLVIEELGPTFIKFGQILSTRPDLLPPEYIAELGKLQDAVPPAPPEAIKEQIERELGRPVEELFTSFDTEPIAAASLGQVHQATLPSGDESARINLKGHPVAPRRAGSSGEAVVVKVQRPGIEEVIETDLEILFDLARIAQERTPLGESYELVEMVEEFATTLRGELDYRREGRNADRFRRNFADEPALYVPKVYWDYTTRRVLTLEQIRGIKINDVAALEAAGIDRHKVAENSARIILKEVFEDGFFHADPHPGNFFVMEDGVIGVMDFGMVGHLDQRVKEGLLRLFIAAVRQDVDGMVSEFSNMGFIGEGVDRQQLKRDLRRLINKYYGLPLEEIRAKELIDDATPIAYRHRLQLPSDLWLLGKTLAMAEGVALQLVPDFDLLAVAEPYARQALREMSSLRAWEERLLKGLGDWVELGLVLPQQVQRFLDRMERGEAQLTMRLEGEKRIVSELDRMANRVSLSILTAAFIVGLALLMQLYRLPGWEWLVAIVIALGMLAASGLGLWLLFSMWRAGRE